MANHIPTIDRLGLAVSGVTAAAMMARAVADHVPDGGDGDKGDCFDAIELYMLRPAAAELQEAYEQALADVPRGAQ